MKATKMLRCSVLLWLVVYIWLWPEAVVAGVYPNYHAHFDFLPLNPDEHNVTKLEANLKWWQTASFYQIYPRSFKDSDGDGVGDLNGITQKLPYLKDIGINAAWISPIFTSPMADFGYDVANYTEIDSIFGTMSDFDALIAKSHEVGVKILLDFVPNHTSDEHEWFKRSAANDTEYANYYIWHPGKMVNGVRQAPNNWISVFHGSAWKWHEGKQAYYLHQFHYKQPDLNYRNPKVKDAMNNVLRFWLAKGVSGFRIDAVPFAYEIAPDVNGNLPDEPHNDGNNDPEDYGYLNHIYSVNQPETLDLVYEWRRVLDQFQKDHGGDERVMLTEAYAPLDVVMKYYGNGTAEGSQIPFNFLLIGGINNGSNAYNYADTVNNWLKNMPAGRTANWVIGNHDQNRVGSRLGADRIDLINMLVLTLPGCSVTYNGEEIGMTDVWISWNDTVDPSACNTNPNIYEKFSRDPERTPFQWSDEKDAGFSIAAKTWLPIASDYKEVNVKLEVNDTRSHLNVYLQLQMLRHENTLRHGSAEVKALNTAVLGIKRTLLHNYTYLILMNINDNAETLDLSNFFSDLPKEMIYVVVTKQSKHEIGQRIPVSAVTLEPKEAVVLRSTTKLTTTVGYFTYYMSEETHA